MDTTLVTTTDVGAKDEQRLVGSWRATAVSGPRWALVAVALVPVVWLQLALTARATSALWVDAAAVGGQVVVALTAALLVRRAATGHLFSSERANRVAGHLLGALTLLPFGAYSAEHAQRRASARRTCDPNALAM